VQLGIMCLWSWTVRTLRSLFHIIQHCVLFTCFEGTVKPVCCFVAVWHQGLPEEACGAINAAHPRVTRTSYTQAYCPLPCHTL